MRHLYTTAAAIAALTAGQVAHAGSLQVAPISVDVAAPAASSTVRIRNESAAPLAAQIRVFRWTQENGVEKLTPTEDVVASPPSANLAAGGEGIVRIVRTGPASGKPEDTYRLIVDELPDRTRQRTGNVMIVMRQSIPIFLRASAASKPRMSFRIEKFDGKQFLTATNTGDRRIRLARLTLADSSGASHSFGQGLSGYVLAGSVMRWALPANRSSLAAAQRLIVTAETDIGPLNETVSR